MTTTRAGGLGPAIVVEPAATLPANADCTLEVADGIRNKRDLPLRFPSTGVAFRTAPE